MFGFYIYPATFILWKIADPDVSVFQWLGWFVLGMIPINIYSIVQGSEVISHMNFFLIILTGVLYTCEIVFSFYRVDL